MRSNLILIVSCIGMLTACHKTNDLQQQPGITDSKNILLNEINIESLPGPYFQFAYDNAGFVNQVSFSAHFSNWRVQYKNNRISRMIDKFNDTLTYMYSNERVVYIRH